MVAVAASIISSRLPWFVRNMEWVLAGRVPRDQYGSSHFPPAEFVHELDSARERLGRKEKARITLNKTPKDTGMLKSIPAIHWQGIRLKLKVAVLVAIERVNLSCRLPA